MNPVLLMARSARMFTGQQSTLRRPSLKMQQFFRPMHLGGQFRRGKAKQNPPSKTKVSDEITADFF